MTNSVTQDRVGYWGFDASCLWIVLGFVLSVFVGLSVEVLLAAWNEAFPHWSIEASLGTLISFQGLLGLPVTVALVGFAVRQSPEVGLRRYLGLTPVDFRTCGVWFVGLFAYWGVASVVGTFIGRPDFPDFAAEAFATPPGMLPLLIFSLVVAVPISEELLYRGLALPGMAAARTGPVVAVCVQSLIWAGVHVQYDAYDMAQVFVLGLLLGASRIRSGSLLPALLMHMAVNAASTAVYLGFHRP